MLNSPVSMLAVRNENTMGTGKILKRSLICKSQMSKLSLFDMIVEQVKRKIRILNNNDLYYNT
ncbi:MAG: hypothetical protein LBI05_09530 [Planctomycetaceae bacterium]|nr:hypothetical protein [Planctomycetaceae bacterium]